MRIESLDIPTEFQKEAGFFTGLGHLRMSRLGRQVVLAGPNGAGKSRLLELLVEISKLRKNFVANTRDLEASTSRSRNKQVYLERLTAGLEPNTSPEKIKLQEVDLQRSQHVLKAHTRVAEAFACVRTPNNADYSIVSYAVERTRLASAEDLSPNEARSRSKKLQQPGANEAAELASAYARQILLQGFNASHRARQINPDRLQLVADSRSLVSLLKHLLGAQSDPQYEDTGCLSLFGHESYEKVLSAGQRVLFQLACAIHAQNAHLHESIIFLDEPENHLHPAALVELFDRLMAVIPQGQIWVATHSVPLIAHLAAIDPNSLWFMDEGVVEHAGRRPEKVLRGLLGSKRGADDLQNFALLPDQLAVNRFLSECLVTPTVVGPDIKDPQNADIARLIAQQRRETSAERSYRVLDFGAGKGRLLASIAAINASTSETAPCSVEMLDYIAFDVDATHSELCKQEIDLAFPESPSERYFASLNKLAAAFDMGSFDMIVMCNVLHEIEPGEWTKLFGPDGVLTHLLRPEGAVLVVEDYMIPVGELAHRYGFLLLDEPELKALFDWRELDSSKGLFLRQSSREERYVDRLVMHWISRDLCSRATSQTRVNAIRKLKSRMTEAIASIRAKTRTYADGHTYALSAQLYANASMWLDENGGT